MARTTLVGHDFEWDFIALDKCVVCGSPSFYNYHSTLVNMIPLHYVKCKQCNVIFQNPRPSEDCLARYFSSPIFMGEAGKVPTENDLGYYDYQALERCYEKNAPNILKLINQFAPSSSTLLEIGVATGWFLNAARHAGYAVTGVDISQSFAAMVNEKYGIEVKRSSVEEADFPSGTFDVICNFGGIACWYDPDKALENVKRLLNGQGIFCFNYANFHNMVGGKSLEYNHATLVIYTRETMHYMMQKHGFVFLADGIHTQYASIKRILWFLRLYKLFSVFEKLGLNEAIVKVPVLGTRLAIVKKSD